MLNSWLSLMPPLIVIIGAFITGRLNTALVLGIVAAACIATDGSLAQAGILMTQRFIEHICDIDILYLYVFLLAIGVLIALFTLTGSAIAFAQAITTKIHKKSTIEASSLLLSTILALDDYLSIMTVGYVMQPVTDRFHIPRLKLAFLVHSLAGAVVILVPISSWVAAITIYLDQAGLNSNATETTKVLADPFFTYLHTIPFIFYSLLIIASVWFIIRAQLSFGPMQGYEKTAQDVQPTPHTPEPFAQDTHQYAPAHAFDLLLPLGALITCMILGITYFTFTHSLKDVPTFLIMCISGITSCVVGIGFSLYKKILTFTKILPVLGQGFMIMYGSILMVILVSILGTILKIDLRTGTYVASLLSHAIPIALLPLTFFLVSLACSIFIGSAWGTFALMLPIAIPMLTSLMHVTTPASPTDLPILFPLLGAIFSGGVCGNHISPIADVTILTATSTGTNPLVHFYTQLPYALPAVISSACIFALSGYLTLYPLWINALISLTTGIALAFSMLYGCNRWWKK
jgi:tetracycline resistance efflux pump